MKSRILCTFFLVSGAFFAHTTLAQNAQIIAHGRFEPNMPLIIEIAGQWADSCTPEVSPLELSIAKGEIVLTNVRGMVACLPVITDYRLFVAIQSLVQQPFSYAGEVTVKYRYLEDQGQAATFSQERVFSSSATQRKYLGQPLEAGVWFSKADTARGMVAEQQGDTIVLYPLAYSSTGSAQWSLAVGKLVGDAMAADLIGFANGQCLGCVADHTFDSQVIGAVSLVVAGAGQVWAQFPGEPFKRMQRFNFSRTSFDLGGEQPVPSLLGGWFNQSSGAFFLDQYEMPDTANDFHHRFFNDQGFEFSCKDGSCRFLSPDPDQLCQAYFFHTGDVGLRTITGAVGDICITTPVPPGPARWLRLQ